MKISTKNENNKKVTLFGKVGIFTISLLTATVAMYLYSPVIKTHANNAALSDVNLRVREALSFTLDKTALTLNTNVNSFVSGTINATVATNSQYGYTLTLEDKDGSTDLVHTNTNITDKMTSSFSGSLAQSSMGANTWGYSLDSTNYYSVPVNGNPATLKQLEAPMSTESETTAVNFGAMVGVIASGVYTDKVVFTAYTNGQAEPIPMPDFRCSSITPEVEDGILLVDPRDNNTYTVSKFPDGNCWMTDNLRINGITISSEDSDMASGSYYIPASAPTEDFADGLGHFDTDGVHVDPRFGGYYTFYNATVGKGTTAIETDGYEMEDSICPKGWDLPTKHDYEWLIEVLDAPKQFSYTGGSSHFLFEHNFGFSGYITVDTLIVNTPIGLGHDSNGDGYYNSGDYWTSTVQSDLMAYKLFASESGTDAVSTSMKSIGNAVRCVSYGQ